MIDLIKDNLHRVNQKLPPHISVSLIEDNPQDRQAKFDAYDISLGKHYTIQLTGFPRWRHLEDVLVLKGTSNHGPTLTQIYQNPGEEYARPIHQDTQLTIIDWFTQQVVACCKRLK